jgi:hypothetical protein
LEFLYISQNGHQGCPIKSVQTEYLWWPFVLCLIPCIVYRQWTFCDRVATMHSERSQILFLWKHYWVEGEAILKKQADEKV